MPYSITEACIGCTACARLCPVFAIQGERGAKHTVNERRCVSCGVCGRVCPKGAVLDGGGEPCAPAPRAQWPRPVIDRELCSACSMCVNICTAGALAITLPEKRGDIRVWAWLANPQKCVGCALCERECPLGAISMAEGGGDA